MNSMNKPVMKQTSLQNYVFSLLLFFTVFTKKAGNFL